ncbi:MAG: DNA translocase FtsK, partial [Atopobiaceae bacterium]|nr:DNA translocase FtsK [Atopobiaceae bacterium]
MPQKRKPNAAAGNQRAGAGRQGAVTFGHASLQNDIVGVVLAIIAIAMLVSLVAPSGAVITHAVERVLTLCFGVGAILCPLTLFLFSLTFFVEGEEPFGGRAALGLLLVSLSILSLISLFAPGAEEDPSIVLQQEMLQDYGGYVGGGVAS